MAKNSNTNKTVTKKSSGGFLIGLVLIIVGSVMLVNNEKDAVNNIKSVDEIKKNVIDIKKDKVNKKYDGKLVAIKGELTVDDELIIDKIYNVKVKTAKLNRIVEMYQYKENEGEDEKENKSYTYEKVWSEKLINSDDFGEAGHINPSSKNHDSEEIHAKSVRVGAYKLSDEQIEKLSSKAEYKFDENTNYRHGYKVIDNYLTNAHDFENPSIGNLRVKYTYNDTKKVSILAKLDGDTFDDYISKSGKTINKIYEGNLNSVQMIERIDKSNKTAKWFKRFLSSFIIIFGYGLLVSMLTSLIDYIPAIGKIINGAISLVMSLIGVIHSLIVIIIAWFVYRPLICLILVLIIGFILCYIKKKKMK